MLIFHDLSRKSEYPTVAALGFFDGVHIGHQKVIGTARAYAQQHGLRLAVFTFAQGPKGAAGAQHILTESQKHAALGQLSVDTCYEPPFSSFHQLAPEAFGALVEMYFGSPRRYDVLLDIESALTEIAARWDELHPDVAASSST